MPLDMPPDINVSTQVKHKTEIVSYFSSTLINDCIIDNDDTILYISPFLNLSNSTSLLIENDNLSSPSTWLEFLVENFDVVSKFTYSKRFKVKAKIKTISKFTPKIIID